MCYYCCCCSTTWAWNLFLVILSFCLETCVVAVVLIFLWATVDISQMFNGNLLYIEWGPFYDKQSPKNRYEIDIDVSMWFAVWDPYTWYLLQISLSIFSSLPCYHCMFSYWLLSVPDWINTCAEINTKIFVRVSVCLSLSAPHISRVCFVFVCGFW